MVFYFLKKRYLYQLRKEIKIHIREADDVFCKATPQRPTTEQAKELIQFPLQRKPFRNVRFFVLYTVVKKVTGSPEASGQFPLQRKKRPSKMY